MVGKCHKNNTNRRKVSVENRNKGGVWERTLGRQRVGCVRVVRISAGTAGGMEGARWSDERGGRSRGRKSRSAASGPGGKLPYLLAEFELLSLTKMKGVCVKE